MPALHARAVIVGALTLALAAPGCVTPGDPITSEPLPPWDRDTNTPYPIQGAPSVADAPRTYKGLPLAITNTGQPIVTPVDGVIGVVCIGMSNARQQCDAFKRGVESTWTSAVSPAVRIANCAVGGHAIERWIDPAFDDVLWRDCVDRVLPAAGIRPGQVRVVHHKAANQFTQVGISLRPAYPSPESEYARLMQHLDRFADRVGTWFPSLQAVYTTTRSYGGFAPPHRGEPLSYESGHALNQWLAENPQRAGVWHGWGAYLWAPECTTGFVTATGLCYVRSDFVADGVHPSPAGEAKAATRMHERFLQHGWYRR